MSTEMGASALQSSLLGTTTLGGRYRPIRRIGSGGMGTVWEAEDLVLHRRVAVKILSPSHCDDETVAARFHREAQAAGRLVHPNIAAVFDYGQEQGCPFIVMELVEGRNLRQVLDERSRLPVDRAVAVAADVADALAAAHAEGIVHRDVKPGNVLLADDGRVKVMDFGIADASWFDPITDTGTVMATARYISPEQATGSSGGPASDVYSLGIVLYEMLAGRPPFQGTSPFAVAAAHAYEVPPPVSRFEPSLPPSVVAIVGAATSKDPRDRPTARALATSLRHRADASPSWGLPVVAASGDDTVVLERVSSRPPRRDGARWLGLAALTLGLLMAVAVVVAATSRGSGAADRSGDGRRPARVAASILYSFAADRDGQPVAAVREPSGASGEGPSRDPTGPDAGRGDTGGGNGNANGNGNGHAYGHDKDQGKE